MPDLDINFKPHPVTGDLLVKSNEDSITQSLKTIVKTAYYERKFWPNLGCQIANALFDNYSTSLTEFTVRKSILEAIRWQEPRAKDVEVTVVYNDGNLSLDCEITFTPIKESKRVIARVFLERVR